MTPSRISKSFRPAAPPSIKRHFRPWYSATLACPSRSQRGESTGMESVVDACADCSGFAKTEVAEKRPATHRPKYLNTSLILFSHMRRKEHGAHDSLAQSGLFVHDFDQTRSHGVKGGSKVFVFARKAFAERRQIHGAFDVVERLKHCWETLAELCVQLVYRAFHQITQQKDVCLIVQNGAVTGHDG